MIKKVLKKEIEIDIDTRYMNYYTILVNFERNTVSDDIPQYCLSFMHGNHAIFQD